MKKNSPGEQNSLCSQQRYANNITSNLTKHIKNNTSSKRQLTHTVTQDSEFFRISGDPRLDFFEIMNISNDFIVHFIDSVCKNLLINKVNELYSKIK